MTDRFIAGRSLLQRAVVVLAMLMIPWGAAAAAVDEAELAKLGFKELVATTDVQKRWIADLPTGRIRPMQRTGKRFFVYPDAARNLVYVGGPVQYAAYVKAHPEEEQNALRAQDAAWIDAVREAKEDAAIAAANQRDLSDPYRGAVWDDLTW